MSNQGNATNGSQRYPINDYRADIVGVLRALFKRKWLVVFGIIGVTVFALLLSVILPKTYRSEGFFQFSEPTREQTNVLFSTAARLLESSHLMVFSQLKELGMLEMFKELNLEINEPVNFFVVSIQDFKKYSSSFRNYQAFQKFVKRNKLLEPPEIDYLKGQIKDSRQFGKLVQEVYALSRDDLKNVGQTLMQEKNYIVGVELEMQAPQPKMAQRFLAVLGQFIRFKIFSEKINEYMAANLNESKALAAQYDNYMLNNRTVRQQLFKKRESLQALYKKYPSSASTAGWQVMGLKDNTERYLTLASQIIGVESQIIELEQLLDSFRIEKRKSELYSAFFSELKNLAEKYYSNGDQLYKEIAGLKDRFFDKEHENDPVVKEIRNSITIDLEKFNTLFYKTLRFITGPSLPEFPEWPRKSIFVIFGFFLGVLLFISIAFILEFWSKNKSLIKPPGK
jgi:LPS O-antigen subunit length determinant protein (WzzB/FepE family)